MSVNPTSADSTSTLTVTVAPSHVIPTTGYLKLTLTSYWSTSIYQTTILNSQSTCLPANVF